tara:strand:- start:2063 stop:2551 length:489 start_codon:yes stop_codon:yes gene_type:complete
VIIRSHHRRLIAHRGNLEGPNPDKENHPDYIHKAVTQGYEIEVDLWRVESDLFLGHDSPQYRINEKYLDLIASTGMLWTHVKNAEAFDYLVSHNKQQWNFFWHQEDDYTLTSLGYIWAYPGKKLTNNSICVLPERANYDTLSIQSSKGVCTDYVYKYEKLLE